MRVLAGELGCGTMSLYSHVKGRDDLIEGIVQALVQRSKIPQIAAKDYDCWQDLMLDVHHAYRDLAFTYPRAFELLALAPFDIFPVAEHLERLVSALGRTGLSTADAYNVFGAFDAYATGFLTVWTRSQRQEKDPDAAATEFLTSQRRPEAYERGLRVLIRGFEAEFAS